MRHSCPHHGKTARMIWALHVVPILQACHKKSQHTLQVFLTVLVHLPALWSNNVRCRWVRGSSVLISNLLSNRQNRKLNANTCNLCSVHSNIWQVRLTFPLCMYKKKLHGLSPRANYTDRATAACQRSDRQLFRTEGATWSAWRIPTAVFSIF
jgi:hypothetical protein